MANRIRGDIGRYGIVPEWLVDINGISDKSIRLYATLSAKYLERDDLSEAFPSRSRLAKDLQCSVNSVDRAVKELEGIGVLIVKRRKDTVGGHDSNSYSVRQVAPWVRLPSPRQPKAPSPTNEDLSRDLITDPDLNTQTVISKEEDKPKEGTVYTAGYVPPPKKNGHSPHRTHFLCTDLWCITLAAHEKTLKRFLAAGLDPREINWEQFYREITDEMAKENVTEQGLWMYKRITEAIEAEG